MAMTLIRKQARVKLTGRDQDLVTLKQHPTRSHTEMKNSKCQIARLDPLDEHQKEILIKPWEIPKHEIPRPQRVIEKGARLLHCQESCSQVF